MNKARSIKQNDTSDALPDFRNLGVMLRVLLLGNGVALAAALLQAGSWREVLLHMMQIATVSSPLLLACLLLLWLAQPWLCRLPYWRGVLLINLMVSLLTVFASYLSSELFYPAINAALVFDLIRGVLLGVATCSVMLMYFRLRTRVFSRAVEDARLQVLRARIRPHFLYNTINAVLGIVRSQPKQAETALEDMADLFRVAMADERELVPLHKEIQLCKQYLALERLRMGERLCVAWQIEGEPDEALIPALLLQPLLENAVYHGIEPLIEGGCIQVSLCRQGRMLQIVVQNPCPLPRAEQSHAGNKIALQNIRERLALLFDAEASYQVNRNGDHYRVEIDLPYMKEQAK